MICRLYARRSPRTTHQSGRHARVINCGLSAQKGATRQHCLWARTDGRDQMVRRCCGRSFVRSCQWSMSTSCVALSDPAINFCDALARSTASRKGAQGLLCTCLQLAFSWHVCTWALIFTRFAWGPLSSFSLLSMFSFEIPQPAASPSLHCQLCSQ